MRNKAFSIAALALPAGLALSLTHLCKGQLGTLAVDQPQLIRAADLGSCDRTVGLRRPLLSREAVHAVLCFATVSAADGARGLADTGGQPASARANILGIVGGASDITLGYEGVTLF